MTGDFPGSLPYPHYPQPAPIRIPANDTQVGGDHYRNLPVQPWDFIHRNGLGFIAGTIISYIARYKYKGGVEDLRKARHCLDKLIEEESALDDPRQPA